MCDTDSCSVLGIKRLRSTSDMKTSINSNSCTPSSSSRVPRIDSSSSSGTQSLDSSWKTMYEDEHTKNTMLNLQLCFVQSECLRLLNLQSDMASSIATLQVFEESPNRVENFLSFCLSTKHDFVQCTSDLTCEMDRRCR